jgi:TRAP-type uncharacterized transport system fused permease subunit
MVDKVAQYLGRRSRYLDIALALIALLWATYQLTFVAYVFHDVILLENTHLLGALLVFCLVGVRQKPHRWLFYLFLMLLGTVPLVYVELFYFEITERTFALTTLDVILGTVLLVAVLVACYDAYGWVLTGLATLFLVYLFFGFLLPGFLQTSKINFDRAISILSMGFTGIYGVALAASASYIFLFLLFGAILQETGEPGFGLAHDNVYMYFARLRYADDTNLYCSGNRCCPGTAQNWHRFITGPFFCSILGCRFFFDSARGYGGNRCSWYSW